MTKNQEKEFENYFGSELSEANNEPTFRFLNFWHQIVIADLVPRSRSLKHCDAFKILYFDKLCSMCSIGSKAET